MIKKKRRYNGFSLVEMLLTLGILGIIMVLVATTLTTLIKVSSVSNSKNQARNDINFIMELMNRSLSGSNISDITMYQSGAVRYFNDQTLSLEDIPAGVGEVYSNPTILVGTPANEIHVRSYGYNVWTCIGYFRNTVNQERGYLLKTTMYGLENHADCFDPNRADAYVSVLQNMSVTVDDFSVEYLVIGDDADNMFIIDATVEPLDWPESFGLSIKRQITRQSTVSSQGLTWY